VPRIKRSQGSASAPTSWIGLLFAIVGVLEVVYVAVDSTSSAAARSIGDQQAPEKLRVTFDSVWPIVPGVVRVSGFRISSTGPRELSSRKGGRVWGASSRWSC